MYELSEIKSKYNRFMRTHRLALKERWRWMCDDEKAEHGNSFKNFTKLTFSAQAAKNHKEQLTEFTKVDF